MMEPMPGTTDFEPPLGGRIGRALASPTGVLLILPLLVVGVGAVTTITAQLSMRNAIASMAEARFADQTQRAARHTTSTLEVADSLLRSYREYLDGQDVLPPPQEMARFLVTLMQERPGVSHTSMGTPAGDYIGVYLDDSGEYLVTERFMLPDGRVRLQDSRIPASGPLEAFREDPDCGYDVRTRPFYDQALRRGRIWTDPYIFFDSGVPGVTCAEPHYTSDGTLLGVLSVDFNLNALSDFVTGLGTVADGRVFIFTRAHDLLAFPGLQLEFGQDRRGSGELVRPEDLDDGRVHAFFADLPTVESSSGPRHFEVAGSDEPILASVTPCPISEDITWYVGALAPESAFMAPARAQLRTALLIAAAALIIALVVATLFARHLVNSRREVARARAALKAARKEVRELGSYQLVRKLGEGGMGEVWLGEHRMLARPAAVKLVHGDVLKGLDQRDAASLLGRFEQEAKVTATLVSPYTIRLYDYGMSSDGVLFYVMELLDGVDLHELVRRNGPVGVGRTVHILRQICSSLDEAHQHGLVHRDIKPANIYLCRKGDVMDLVKVLDFGLVQMARQGDPARPSQKRQAAGTPAFMAPEQARGSDDLDGRTDLYAVGCLGYWLLTGRQVFHQDSVEKLVKDHIHSTPSAPSAAARVEVPPSMDRLILWCLAKERHERPASARALREALDEVPVPEGQQWDSKAMDEWWRRFQPSGRDEGSAEATLPAPEIRVERGTTLVMPTAARRGE